jgi:methionine synthase II (cobalamin-independent)
MILPTSGVGSHGLPGWVWLAREAMDTGRLGRLDVQELLEDATQAALLDQERGLAWTSSPPARWAAYGSSSASTAA